MRDVPTCDNWKYVGTWVPWKNNKCWNHAMIYLWNLCWQRLWHHLLNANVQAHLNKILKMAEIRGIHCCYFSLWNKCCNLRFTCPTIRILVRAKYAIHRLQVIERCKQHKKSTHKYGLGITQSFGCLELEILLTIPLVSWLLTKFDMSSDFIRDNIEMWNEGSEVSAGNVLFSWI